jgi:predicted HicB family RNase H-like nuclease
MKQVNLKLDEDEHKALRVLAVLTDKGLNEIIVDIIKEYTTKHCPKIKTTAE